jgi:hypothetical protein
MVVPCPAEITLAAILYRLYPHLPHVGGEEMSEDGSGSPVAETPDIMRAYCLRAKEELGLQTYSIEETVRANGDSYLALGLVKQQAPKL